MAWTAVVRQPERQAYAAAIALERRVWELGAAAAFVFGALGWWLSGRLTAPLRQLARRALASSQGDAASPSNDEVVQLTHALSTLIDDLKVREGALRQLNENLERRVQERTASLEQANEDLRSFSRSVSHDVRAPLGSVATLLRSLLRRQAMPPDAARVVTLAAGECERVRELTEDLLTLAHVEQREMAQTTVDMNLLVEQALDDVRLGSPRWQPEVHVRALPAAVGDATLLRQMMANLLSNAFKFTGGVAAPRVEISARVADGEATYTVTDNGAGFDPTKADRLFGAFVRLHSAREFPGTGVGLSIVKRVVQRHGGRVWAESEPHRGSSFHFTLRAAQSEPALDVAHPAAVAAVTSA